MRMNLKKRKLDSQRVLEIGGHLAKVNVVFKHGLFTQIMYYPDKQSDSRHCSMMTVSVDHNTKYGNDTSKMFFQYLLD